MNLLFTLLTECGILLWGRIALREFGELQDKWRANRNEKENVGERKEEEDKNEKGNEKEENCLWWSEQRKS
jgi:hypothetical protein